MPILAQRDHVTGQTIAAHENEKWHQHIATAGKLIRIKLTNLMP
jgi:hypothetical protein